MLLLVNHQLITTLLIQQVKFTADNILDKEWFYCQFVSFLGGKYTKEDFKAYEKDLDNKSKLALKDNVKTKQEYPSNNLFTLKSYLDNCISLYKICTLDFTFNLVNSPKRLTVDALA